MARKEYAAHRKLWFKPTDWGLRIIGLFLFVLGAGFAVVLSTYRSVAAVVMWVVTWSFLMIVVLWRMRTSVSDREYRINRKFIGDSVKEIGENRIAAKHNLMENELNTLRRGEKTTVLDIWRLDQSLSKRHAFFAATTSLLIDPKLRELHLRIQHSEIRAGMERGGRLDVLWRQLCTYLRVITVDPYLLQERGFFDRIIVVVDGIMEDDRHVDVPYPILSICIGAEQFWSIAAVPYFDARLLNHIANVRFDRGNEVTPHRSIETAPELGLN